MSAQTIRVYLKLIIRL